MPCSSQQPSRPSLEQQPGPAQVHPLAAIRGLKEPALRTLSTTSIFYNFAFFILLAYSPFPLEAAGKAHGIHVGAMGIGWVFFGWGLALAIASVIVAPVLTRKLGLIRTLLSTLAGLTVLMVLLAIFHASFAILIALIICGDLFLGVMNTVLTETVMEATALPRSIASSAYSSVRFFGDAIAPAAAGPLAASVGAASPYILAALSLIVSTIMLILRRHTLHRVTRPHLPATDEAEAIAIGNPA